MSAWNANTVGTLSVLACIAYLAAWRLLLLARKKTHPLPPGPRAWPVIGNIPDMPPSGVREWEFWLQHKDKYGPISSVTALGTTIVVLHSRELASELLEKRSAIYSSRPRSVFGADMCGWELALSSLPYTDRVRAYRKPIHAIIGSKTGISQFGGLQDVEVHRFLLRVLEKPADLLSHIRTEAGAIILKLAYGYTIEPHGHDPLVDIADRALEQFSSANVPGIWLVDTIPALRYLPEWMFGAGFKKTAREWKATLTELTETPIKFVKKQMAEGHFEPSYVSGLYEKAAGEEMDAEESRVVKGSAMSLYTGGADTTVGVISMFYLAMTLYPEVQRKAQEEIDRVVGTGRLPSFSDRENLPYVEAAFKEAFRWHPLAPMGLPHATTADDFYGGYLIPKGAIVITNNWWFAHDPAVYPEPESFDPTRFLGPNPAPNPASFAFGYGRRRCPGKQLADHSVWLTIARSLAVFDITKGVDENGKEIEPDVIFTPGIISHPEPYRATIKPRSSGHEDLVRQIERLHPWEKSSADQLEDISTSIHV